MAENSRFFEAYDCPLCNKIHRKGHPCDATINIQQDPLTKNEIVIVTNKVLKVFLSNPRYFDLLGILLSTLYEPYYLNLLYNDIFRDLKIVYLIQKKTNQ